MRPDPAVRAVLTGALSMTMMLSLGAPAAGQVEPENDRRIPLVVRDVSLRYGQAVVVSGRLLGAPARQAVQLEFRPRGASVWTPVKSGRTEAGGMFRLAAGLHRSGAVRVTGGPAARAAAGTTTARASSAVRAVRVRAHIVTQSTNTAVVSGRAVSAVGELRPGVSGRTVALQVRRGARWTTVARDRTDRGGRYAVRHRARQGGPARLRFTGDAGNSGAVRSLPRVALFRGAHASWYGPGLYGNRLGCGGRLSPGTVGIAHKTLPCGSRVTLRFRGRTVRTRVIDRGPYVAGREVDLTYATKRRLAFGSTGTILLAVG